MKHDTNFHFQIIIYFEGHNLVNCNNICAVMDVLDHEDSITEWRLFIDFLKTGLKAALLNNGNILPSVPVAYATVKAAISTNEKAIV